MEQEDIIACKGVRTHNLKNIDIAIPLKKWTVITGVSGSGKSSLVFHTIYSEAQRRFLETLGTYERQFLQGLPEGEFDSIENIPAAIALKQTHKMTDSRSTIATASDISIPLQIIFTSLMDASCVHCGNAIVVHSHQTLCDFFSDARKNTFEENYVLSVELTLPDHLNEQKKILHNMLAEGYTRFIHNNQMHDIVDIDSMSFDTNQKIEIVLDRIQKDLSLDEIQNRISHIWSQVRFSQRFHVISVKKIDRSGSVDSAQHVFYTQPYCMNCQRATTIIQAHDLDAQSISGIRNAKCHNLFFTDLFYQEIHLTLKWFESLKDETRFEKKLKTLNEVYNEVIKKLALLVKLGLGTNHLFRTVRTLSGGEYQRVLLARVIGNGLSDALYILDEPSIGLGHEEINEMIVCIRELRDLGNTILMVEHDKKLIAASDKIFEFGPGGGHEGGQLLEIKNNTPRSFNTTICYRPFSDETIITNAHARLFSPENSIVLKNFTALNCKNLDVELAFGKINLILGVSGAGKSTLLNYGIRAALETFEDMGHTSHSFFDAEYTRGIWDDFIVPKNFLSNFHCVNVRQSAAHRSVVSVPATYLGLMNIFRKHFSQTASARALGLNASDFSFNGRGACLTCDGKGVIEEDLFFLGHVEKQCPDCLGNRYKKTSLGVTWLGKTIQEWLSLNISEALQLLGKHSGFGKPLVLAKNLGLGYLPLGISTASLSGGEMQRLRICATLSEKENKKMFCLLDEPSRGLSEFDVGNLIESLIRFTHTGHTFVIVEHHDLFKQYAHHVIKLGPGGGVLGGKIVERKVFNNVE